LKATMRTEFTKN